MRSATDFEKRGRFWWSDCFKHCFWKLCKFIWHGKASCAAFCVEFLLGATSAEELYRLHVPDISVAQTKTISLKIEGCAEENVRCENATSCIILVITSSAHLIVRNLVNRTVAWFDCLIIANLLPLFAKFSLFVLNLSKTKSKYTKGITPNEGWCFRPLAILFLLDDPAQPCDLSPMPLFKFWTVYNASFVSINSL